MNDLIERLEKATGPDREIDGLIYGYLNGLKRNGGTFQVGDNFQFEHPTKRFPNGPAALYVRDDAVHEFTSSLDAALTLVPEGWIWDVSSTGCAWIMPRNDLNGQLVIGGIEHPAIAMCIAAIQARAALKTGYPHVVENTESDQLFDGAKNQVT